MCIRDRLGTAQYSRLYVRTQLQRYLKAYEGLGGASSYHRLYEGTEANYRAGHLDDGAAYAGALTNYEGSIGPSGGYTKTWVDAEDDTGSIDLSYATVYAGAGTTTSYSKTSIANFAKNYGGTFARQWSTVLYYIGYYTGIYTKQYTKEYAKVWTGQYEGVFTASYTGQYIKQYEKTWTGQYTKNWNRAYTKIWSQTYTGVYTKLYAGAQYYGGNTTGSFSGLRTHNFTTQWLKQYGGQFEGSFTEQYSGLFAHNYITVSYTHLTLPTKRIV